MVTKVRAFFIFAFITCAVASWAVPGVLIVQHQAKKVKEADPNLEIADYMAQSVYDDGRLSPIVWSMTDEVYRNAVAAGTVSHSTDDPTLEQAEVAARALKCDYILFVEAHQEGNSINSKASFFKADRMIWHDPMPDNDANTAHINHLIQQGKIKLSDQEKISRSNAYRHMAITSKGALSIDNTLRSVANTWIELLKAGPLKNFVSMKQSQGVEQQPGAIAPLNVAPVVPVKVDNVKIFSDVEAAKKDGRLTDAILILRDAVDAAPEDLPRRQALVKLLNEANLPELAAEEASRAANLMTNAPGFHVEGARAALVAGDFDQATNQANEALARNPANSDARLVLAEVALYKLDYSGALPLLDTAINTTPTAEGYYYRSLDKSFMGDAAGANTDWKSAQSNSLSQPLPAYSRTIELYDLSVGQMFGALRSLLPQAAVKGDPAKPKSAAATQLAIADASARLLALVQTPKSHYASHQRRVLALKLLAQSCSEVFAYLTRSDDDALVDARINLGEAIKQYAAAKELFKRE